MAEDKNPNTEDHPMNAALRGALAQLDDPTLTIIGAARASIDAALRRPIDPSRIAERDLAIADFVRQVVSEARALVHDRIGTARTKLQYALGPLAQPTPKPSEIDRVWSGLAELGYSGGERDIIERRLFADKSARIGRFDEKGIEIGDQYLSRYDLRESARPASFTSKATWHAQFPKLTEEKAI